MTLERIVMPELRLPRNLDVKKAEPLRLDNGLRVYVVNSGSEPVVKLELVFGSGTSGSADYALASATHQLIDSGTTTKSAPEVAEAFDYFGSYLQTEFGPDWKSISLYSLTRFFSETATALMEVLQTASYPAAELENWKTRSIQSLLVNREKVSWQAKTAFNEALYGYDHPYGYTINEAAIQQQDAGALHEFYNTSYTLEKALILISGNISDEITDVLNKTLGSVKISGSATNDPVKIPEVKQKVKKHIPKKDALQSGIRIGKVLFSKNHPDYPALQIANTILGGYFGSRLMSNIREDKGYTYGIGSGIHPLRNSGFFFISTEVGNDVREAAIKEIYHELRRLSEEPVSQEELNLVRNYLTGAFQRSIDGPFALADRFKSLYLYGLDYDYVDNYLALLRDIQPQKIMKAVEEHLRPETMTEIISG